MPFTRGQIETIGADWADASERNDDLDALRAQRVELLVLEGDLLRSKLVWKFAVMRQSLTYRAVNLAEAAIDQWEAENILACTQPVNPRSARKETLSTVCVGLMPSTS